MTSSPGSTLPTYKLLVDKICEQETDKEKQKKFFSNCNYIDWHDDETRAYIKSICEEDLNDLDGSQRKRRKIE